MSQHTVPAGTPQPVGGAPGRVEPRPAGQAAAARRRAIWAGAVGNTVEWVDWAVYSTFSSVFAGTFFPSHAPGAALLSTLAVFAVGFLMRPVGGAVLGVYGDRHGRKKAMTLTISMMAGAALIIAVCPGYGTIGVAAPVVLVVARLVQGFSAGGEFGTSSAFLVESAAPARRAFAGSWQQVSVGAGTLIASLMGTILTSSLDQHALETWGWRIAFAVGGVLGLVGLWLRVTVEETESFRRVERTGTGEARPNPLRTMLVAHPRAALRVVGVTVAGTLIYYLWVSYMPSYVHVATGMPLDRALLANTISLAVFIVLLPFGGMLSDRVGRKPTMLGFAAGFLVLAWPLFHLLGDNFWTLLGIELVGMVLIVGYSANCAVIMAEQFPPEVRTTGIALPYALAVAVFGGTAPYITTWMSSSGHRDLVWIYLAAAALVGVVVYALMPETKGKEIA